MEDKKPKLSIIIVNYRSAHNLKECVASLLNWPDIKKAEVIVVNNDEKESVEWLERKDPSIKVINSPKNLGFGPANNLGAKKSSGEILFFLNPDAKILKGKLKDILDEFGRNTKLGIIGGRLFGKNGKIQPWSAGKEVTLLKILLNNLGIWRDRKIWESKKKKEADWVAATAFFMRRDIFEKASGFDEKIFMYFEDIDLCVRTKKMGYQTLYLPRFLVSHLGGESYESKKQQKKHYYDSQGYYFKKHRPKWEACLVGGIRKIFKK